MLQVKKLHRFALLPIKRYGDAAYDFYSCEAATIKPYERKLICTGLACAFPSNYVARVCDRSGMAAKRGLHVMAGVIDSTYRGEWKILLFNTTATEQILEAQTRIAQVLFYEVADFSIQEVDELGATSRGAGGFGSTGDN
jgi:deoxyuridine 5'-triphosphate nucleotidohydrolase